MHLADCQGQLVHSHLSTPRPISTLEIAFRLNLTMPRYVSFSLFGWVPSLTISFQCPAFTHEQMETFAYYAPFCDQAIAEGRGRSWIRSFTKIWFQRWPHPRRETSLSFTIWCESALFLRLVGVSACVYIVLRTNLGGSQRVQTVIRNFALQYRRDQNALMASWLLQVGAVLHTHLHYPRLTRRSA